MAIYQVTQEKFVALRATTFASRGLRERDDLQRLLRDQIEIIDPDVMVVGEEFADWQDSRRRIDLLCIDKAANLVVVELKRSEDGGHMELQAIRYAAMVSKMTFEKVEEVFQHYLTSRLRKESARELLLDFLGWETPNEEQFAQDVRIVLVSAEFSRELTTAVLWLNERNLDIRCVRIRPHVDGERVFVDVQQVLPLPEASDYFVSLREKKAEERQSRERARAWSGLWFVNIGMHDADRAAVDENGQAYCRHWSYCVTYGYLAAGHGLRYSGPLRKLQPGDHVMAYQRGAGYLGYGVVNKAASPIHTFSVKGGGSLAERLGIPHHNLDKTEDLWEYAVGVDWVKHYPLSNPQTFKGVFANQNVVCKLSDPQTVEFVKQRFGIDGTAVAHRDV